MALARPRVGIILVALVPLGFLTLFFAWPVVAIVGLGARAAMLDTLASSDTWQLVGFTLGQAAASTVVAIAAGMPLAFLLARCKLPGRGLVQAIVLVPFVLPAVVVGLAFRGLMPDGGVWSIILANAFFNVAVVARTVGGLWANTDRRAEDAARALGASRLRAFTAVTLPALTPAIGSAAAVVFLFCSTSFGVVLILGGAEYRTLETEIYLRTVQLFDLPGAAALSILQLAAVVAALVIGAVARKRRQAALKLRGRQETARRPVGGEWVVVGIAYGVLVLLLTPIVSLVSQSSVEGFRALSGTGHDNSLEVTGLRAAMNSLSTATDATVLALILGVLSSIALMRLGRSAELVDVAMMLPLGVSAVTVGFGYLITLDALPGDLRTSPLLVPLAQAIVVTPLIIRILLPVLRSIDDRLRQAAGTLGASPLRVWLEVDLPLAGRSLVTAAAFGYVVALGEFGATSFLARPDAPTLPIAIGRLISRPGELNTQMAYAACTLLMVVTIAVAVLIERFRTTVEEF
ncbi:Binding-protein-dependent transport systems inner membrane component [Kibdelosporangium sp. 4NS15]|uniref:Binding-protein-dependent transport systems inner membrane component n=1 Tax=Kibdelosporangium persicum TaxID=2698649 RepID=A0ABX2F8S5_9PSEU|nr:Binding-protein-dependent transport systems inner membrane component [Kibdelosporangium persicum]